VRIFIINVTLKLAYCSQAKDGDILGHDAVGASSYAKNLFDYMLEWPPLTRPFGARSSHGGGL